MKIEVVTLFPAMVRQALEFGITGRAIRRGLLSVGTEDPRDHTTDVHRTVDDRPYGGGPGMVMKPEPLTAAIAAAAGRVPAGSRRIYLSAQGARFDQKRAAALKDEAGLVLVAGRYEGIDERVIATSIDEEL
jgi:tRNA (guanine37-N1)-methyltransferase